MQYYSQRDVQYSSRTLPKSNLTMGNYGCYVTSIAMLGQVHPTSLLLDNNFASGGLLYSARAASTAGIVYKGISKLAANGWCIGVTDNYAKRGYPTHFFLVNAASGLQIDPLKNPAKPEKLSYNCFEYRIFDNIKLGVPSSKKEIEDCIKSNSEAWHKLEDAKQALNKSNNLLRSLL